MSETTPSKTEFEKGWDVIQNGITKLKKILDGLPEPQFNSEEQMEIYTIIYNMCTQKIPHCEQLYDKYKQAIEEYLTETVLPSIKEKYDEFILRELVKRWKNHNVMVKWMSRFFTYLDRYFIKRNDLSSLYQVGKTCFQELIYQEVHSSVKDAVIGLIARDRKGEQIDRGLLKNALDILVQVGTRETNYANDFEADMLEETASYYSRKASKWILKYSCPEYMSKTEECLKRERKRVFHYLYERSESKLVETVEKELLGVHANQLLVNEQSGCLTLLRDEKVDDLTRICRLYHKIPEGSELVARMFRQHVTDEGLAIVNQATETAKNKAENGGSMDEHVLVRKLLELHDKYKAYMIFMNHTSFHKALKEAFEVFCNKKVADVASVELLAAFCDNILRKGGSQKLSYEAIEDTLEKVVQLLAFVHDKDLFAEFYKKKLSRRLLFEKSYSNELEKSILTKMKRQYGGQFTSHMEGTVMDFILARENQAQFEEHFSNHSLANPKMDFNVTVLTTGYWPSYKTSDINLPAEMARCVEVFKEFYHNKSKKRRLNWIYSLGHCNIMGKFDSKPIELVVSTFQAVVLLLFNNSDGLSYSEIKDQSNLGDDDLVRVLFSLSCAKYKILNKEPSTKTLSPTDSFKFNSNFTDKMRRIKIPLPLAEERKKIVEDVDNGRRYLVDASIVRIMKSRKILSHQELITECVDQLKSLFKPDIKIIKKRIDELINREYLERDKEIPNTYRYLA